VMLAARQHYLDAVKLLVELGDDPCAKNHDGETAVDMAESNLNNGRDKDEIISLLKIKCR
jgi:ankyrin repeat protein